MINYTLRSSFEKTKDFYCETISNWTIFVICNVNKETPHDHSYITEVNRKTV